MIKASISIVATLAFQSLSFAADTEMSLFESTDAIRRFLAGKTEHNYTEFTLTRVSLEYIEDSAKSGHAYAYFFNHREGGTGSGLTIYHFIDGTILERTFGP